MAEFTADIAQLESIAGQLKSLGSQIDGVASRVYSTSQSISGIKSLQNKGYAGMIHNVRSSLRSLADDTSMMSGRVTQIANVYSSTESKVSSSFLAGSAENLGGAVTGRANGKSSVWDILRDALGDEINSIVRDSLETSELIEDFHRWRATTGSDMVKSIYKDVEKIPFLKGIIGDIVDEYNKDVTDLENVVYGALNIPNTDALAKGAGSFASLLGFGWVPDVAKRLDSQSQYYMDKGAQQIKDGHVAQGLFTALGGGLVAFTDMAIDTSVKTLKWVVKDNPVVKAAMEIPGVKQIVDAQTKVTKAVTKIFTGKEYETAADAVFGSIGDGIKGAFDNLTNWGRKK